MKDKIASILMHVTLIVISFICVFPFLWMLIGITNTSTAISKGKMTFGTNLFANIQSVIEKTEIGHIIFNSIFIAVVGTVLTLVVTSMAAYAFQIYHSKMRETIYNILLLSMMIPFAALMIPLYKEIVAIGLLNTYWAIILQLSSSAFLVFFFRQSLKNFPTELIESSRIDGANEFTIFLKVVVPAMKSTYAAATIYAFMGAWNTYLWPLLVLKTDEMKTFPLAISVMSSSHSADIGAVMVMVVVSTIPTMIIFFAFQKQFVQGMVGTSK